MARVGFRIDNEFDFLTHVVMGTARGYHRDPSRVEVVNERQRTTFESAGRPAPEQLQQEFNAFRDAMQQHGVQVYEPVLAPESVQDQTCPRDIGFVVGDVLVIAAMRSASRKEEFEGVKPFLQNWSGRIIEAPAGTYIEGGDVILDGDCLFVGTGQRSNEAGLAFVEAQFGRAHKVVPVPCKPVSEGEDVLHLDCAFNPLGGGHALIYPDGLAAIPAPIRERYEWIEVNRAEAAALATNVLSIAPRRVIARACIDCAGVNDRLRALDYDVIEVEFDGVPSTGGSFRCATMPLRRESAHS